jgi:tripartite-type tricarboxylate transporter receptor subunit TctC
MKTHLPIRGITLFVALAALIFTGSLAGAADFYAGKTITVVCPYSTGGTYDRMSRLAARFLPRHIPGNPAAIVHNRPGAGGVIGLRSVYKAEPDGLSLIHFTSPAVVRSLTGGIKDIDFKKLTWLGSVGGAHYIFAIRSDRPERSIADFKNTKKPIRVGASGPSSLLTQAPKFLQRAGKFNIRLVSGYKGYNPMALAMKQNEVDAVTTAGVAIRVNTATREMHKDGTIKLVLSMGGAPPPAPLKAEVAALPKFVDAIDDPKDRDVWVAFSGLLSASRPFGATPGLPPERAAILKKAMADMMADPEFVKTATDQGFVLNTLNSQEAENLILSVFNLSAEIQDRLKALLK